MELTEEQKATVKCWAAEGARLPEIQSRLKEQFGIQLSYMETRFLVIDIEAEIQDPPSPEEPKKPAPNVADGDEADEEGLEDVETDPLPATGEVSVEINPIARPGFAVGGTVVFSDGVQAEWGVTVDGRLSLEADSPEYRPTDADVRTFQLKLRDLFAQQGMR